jgi:hypothetical protein
MNDERRPARNAAATNQPPPSVSAPAVPAIVIEFRLEAAPRVWQTSASEEESARLLDWINAGLDRRRIVNLALELMREAQAA